MPALWAGSFTSCHADVFYFLLGLSTLFFIKYYNTNYVKYLNKQWWFLLILMPSIYIFSASAGISPKFNLWSQIYIYPIFLLTIPTGLILSLRELRILHCKCKFKATEEAMLYCLHLSSLIMAIIAIFLGIVFGASNFGVGGWFIIMATGFIGCFVMIVKITYNDNYRKSIITAICIASFAISVRGLIVDSFIFYNFKLLETKLSSQQENNIIIIWQRLLARVSSKRMLQLEKIVRLNLAKQFINNNRYTSAFRQIDNLVNFGYFLKLSDIDFIDAQVLQRIANIPSNQGNHYVVLFAGATYRLFVDMEISKDGNIYILDRWGRIFAKKNSTFSLVDFKRNDDKAIKAVDLNLFPDYPDSFIVMDNQCNLRKYGIIPDWLLEIISDSPYNIKDAVKMIIEPSLKLCLVLDTYGSIHTLPKEKNYLLSNELKNRKWHIDAAADLCSINNMEGFYLLDVYGSIHTFGKTKINTKTREAPYFYWNIARSIFVFPDEQCIWLLDGFGAIHTLGNQKIEFDRGSPDIANLYACHDHAIDMEIDLDSKTAFVLDSSGGIFNIPILLK